MNFIKKYKRLILWIGFALCFTIVIGIMFSVFCAINFADLSDAMPCTSIVFDKRLMSTVDRIDVYNSQSGKNFTITEDDIIKLFVKETMVATNTDVQCSKDIEIKLFSDNKLIRTMYSGTDYIFVNVYNEDRLHWCLFKVTKSGEGYVMLSNELQQLLTELER